MNRSLIENMVYDRQWGKIWRGIWQWEGDSEMGCYCHASEKDDSEFLTEDSCVSLQYGCLGQSIQRGQASHHCTGTATILDMDLMKGQCQVPSVTVGMRGVLISSGIEMRCRTSLWEWHWAEGHRGKNQHSSEKKVPRAATWKTISILFSTSHTPVMILQMTIEGTWRRKLSWTTPIMQKVITCHSVPLNSTGKWSYWILRWKLYRLMYTETAAEWSSE